ncbi:MAG: hypothetical protein COU06_01195 [Candidatus Harrisonbacteria bacterium CG10_big_fil_rev_8_21_14_0_10_38_8]|uniref:TraC-like domain-containing protein n=1 Tax=Candidatus Harrisonbacteria bacterium CG10_big_fil_rev_8_21_14_0_10_38_8 TaxID=1974582 RepID=A0A2M6WK97_9BACT|nr:MAG: hypothetical protein COU06_01195 [Candidatus Harrisonbacteria bacterium CG10_big_fil_rev_8_21_14_0_10_38_8]
MVSGVNFELKSEDEQNAITYSYQNFLNSLNFSIQIFIHSRKINTDAYIAKMQTLESAETNPLLKTQIQEYREFIKAFVNENAIMDKAFFVVVPFDPVKIPSSGGLLKKKKSKEVEENLDKDFNRNLNQLQQRVDQVITGLNQIGLRAIQLKDDEIVEFLYNLYNPEEVEKKDMALTEQNKRI